MKFTAFVASATLVLVSPLHAETMFLTFHPTSILGEIGLTGDYKPFSSDYIVQANFGVPNGSQTLGPVTILQGNYVTSPNDYTMDGVGYFSVSGPKVLEWGTGRTYGQLTYQTRMSVFAYKVSIDGFWPSPFSFTDASSLLTQGAHWTIYDYQFYSGGGEKSITYWANLVSVSSINPLAPAAPVPEPEAYAMVLAGLGLLRFVAARKERAGERVPMKRLVALD